MRSMTIHGLGHKIAVMRWRYVFLWGVLTGLLLVGVFWVAMDRIMAPMWVEEAQNKSERIDDTYCRVQVHSECAIFSTMETEEQTPTIELITEPNQQPGVPATNDSDSASNESGSGEAVSEEEAPVVPPQPIDNRRRGMVTTPPTFSE